VVPKPALESLQTVRIAVDCMGGDHGPAVTLPACLAFLNKHPQAELLLVGTADALAAARGYPRCTVVVATEVVTMDDSLEVALRRKRDSSMRVAVNHWRSRLCLGWQHRSLDGAVALCAEDLGRHRPPGFGYRDAAPA
jgi:hypothetical protein